MENSSPPRHHRLAWLALATLGTLLLLPATRYLVRSQMQMEALTYSTETNLPAERAAAARMSDDYPVQLALAAETPSPFAVMLGTDPMAQSKARNRRIAALIPRFPNSPSVCANLLRYMMLGEVRMQRTDGDPPPASAVPAIPYQPSLEAREMFENAAQKGVQLDPDNAYFRMMQAIGLFNAHRDSEALDALKAAGRCSHWAEYYQDEASGQNRLQAAVYGERGAVQRVNNAANLLFPQYASLRSEARLVRYLAGNAELAGNTEEALAVRHALMRCGGLMRSQGNCYITTLVGIAITNIGTASPGGIQNHATLSSSHNTGEEAEQLRAKRLQSYYTYLESIGHPEEAVWAKTEIAAGEQARAIGAEGLKNSVFNGRDFSHIGFSWLANIVVLSSALVLLALGAAASLAGTMRPKRTLLAWRSAYALLVLGGIGLWQWNAAHVGMAPFVEIQKMFSDMSGNRMDGQNDALGIQLLTFGLSVLVPVLFVGLIAGIALFQRVPLATGLGRGLRGAAIPGAAMLFLVYGASLLPTVHAESVIKTELVNTARNEPSYFAECIHKVWPGDPQP